MSCAQIEEISQSAVPRSWEVDGEHAKDGHTGPHDVVHAEDGDEHVDDGVQPAVQVDGDDHGQVEQHRQRHDQH